MEVGVFNIDEEKEKLTQKLSEQYAQNIINMEEYERIVDYINKIETVKEVNVIERIIDGNNVEYSALTQNRSNEIMMPKGKEKYLSAFSWRTTNVKPINGHGGEYISFFGTNRIIMDNLPKGRTVIKVNSIFGLTEIIVSKNIKVINKAAPIFSGIFIPAEINKEDEELPELYIVGKAVFGNITVKTIEQIKQEKEFEEKYAEEIKQNMLDKISRKK
jgi:hypothetical protein